MNDNLFSTDGHAESREEFSKPREGDVLNIDSVYEAIDMLKKQRDEGVRLHIIPPIEIVPPGLENDWANMKQRWLNMLLSEHFRQRDYGLLWAHRKRIREHREKRGRR